MPPAIAPNLPDFAIATIRRTARRLANRPGFAKWESEDLEQELRLHLLRRIDQFDARLGHINTFIATVIGRKAASLVTNRSAQCRTYRLAAGTFEDWCESNGDADNDAGYTLADDCHARRTGCGPLTSYPAQDLKLDIESVLALLPRRLGEIARRLQRDSPTVVARDLKISGKELRASIERIRETLTEKLFADNPKKVGTNRPAFE